MNTQEQQGFFTREFRIGALAVLAVIVLAAAAYFFGTGLQADTPASVAPSPLGSSLTSVRESTSPDYVGRLINASEASRAEALAALAQSQSDFHADVRNAAVAASPEESLDRLISPSAAARLTALAALAKSRSDFHAEQSAAARAAARTSMIERSGSADYAARAAGLWFDIPAAGTLASQPATSPSGTGFSSSSAAERSALLETIERSGSADYAERAAGLWFDIPAAGTQGVRPASPQDSASQPSATGSGASMAELAERWAPFYAGLDKALTDAGARPSAQPSNSAPELSADEQYQWIKPEGIKPSEGSESRPDQFQWIKPEGVRAE